MEKSKSPWSVPVAVDDIPDTGLHVETEPTMEIRTDLAKLAGLRELSRLSATFDLTRRGAGVHVIGCVSGKVGQTCVITLEPIENDIDEPIDLLSAPARDAGGSAKPPADGGGGEQEPPELLVDGQLDLGAIATEFLLLGIDPYPRKAGAEFNSTATADPGAKPFAALESLKKRMGGG